MQYTLKQLAQKKLILVAHRGSWGGNIPCNTIAAYEIALQQGADMIEIDVDCSADGELFVFHPTMEPVQLKRDLCIEQMPAQQVRELRYVNMDDAETQFGLETLDDVLERFKNRCYINVDKFCRNPEQIAAAIRKHGMEDQILVKTAPTPEYLETIARYCPEIPYMAIIRDPSDIERVKQYPIRYIGNEVLFTKDDSPFASKSFVDAQHRDGLLVWCNAIVYDYRDVLSAGHNDDLSLTQNPSEGWGWIAERGYDFLQTDWIGMADAYLRQTGCMMRKK